MPTPTPSSRRSGPSARSGTPRFSLVHRGWLGYAFAIFLVVAATALTHAFEPLLERTIGILFFASITFVAWFGGLGPALLATLASVLVLDVRFMDPRTTLSVRPQDLIPLTIFGGIGAFISWITYQQRRAEFLALRDADALDEIRQQLEQRTHELERYRDFLEEAQRSASIGSWEWDIDTNKVSWSDEMYRVYGLEPRAMDITLEGYRRFVHADDRDMIAAVLARAIETKQPFSYVHRIIRPDGSLRWVRGRGKPVVDANGRVVRMVGSGQDITDSHRNAEAQRLLADASEALASSLDYTTTLSTLAELCVGSLADWVSIAIGDATGRHANLAVAHRDPERVKWAREYNRMHPPRFDAPTGVAQVLRTGKSEFYPEITREMLVAAAMSEDEVKVLDELRIRSAMVVPMRARGRTLGAITFISSESAYQYTKDDLWLAERLANRAAIAIDNARLYEEARLARIEAENANRAKMDFLAAMSHELRTPINAIAGYTQLLEMGIHGPLTSQQREALQRLDRSQRHLLALVEDVLTFARVEAGRMQFRYEPASVDRVVREAAELIGPQARTKGLAFEYSGTDPNLTITTDDERLGQILVNLLTNAVKFTESGGRITMDVREEPEAVSISVADTGVGIPLDRQEEIFEPFVQLEQRKERRASGMGLGLAISRDLARALGGEIFVTSEVGKGSTFTLRLPRAPRQTLALRGEPAAAEPETA